MFTPDVALKSAIKKLTPWKDEESESSGIPFHEGRVPAATIQTMIDGAVKILPYIPDRYLLSIFRGNIDSLPYPESREFAEQGILALKRALGSSTYKRAMHHYMKTMIGQQFDISEKRYQYKQKYGRLPPTLIVVSPTMRCNLRCYGCYAGEYQKADDLPRDVLERVIKELRSMGIFFVTVTGGEPFVSQDVLDMWADNPDMLFLTYTNGSLINEDMAARLAKMGNVVPFISVEGYEDETDARRGKGTYRKVMMAMDNLREAGVPFGFSATATRGNNELVSSPEFVDYYSKKGCLAGWYFNYMPIGREPNLDLMPTPEQRIARWQRIRDLRKSKHFAMADFWCDGPIVGGCIAGGRSYLHINNNGDVEPCVFVHFAADNVKNKSLTEILESPFFQAIRSRQPFSKNMLRPCMIIDNPEVLRQVVAEGNAKPTHRGAEAIIGELSPKIDDYAAKYASLADPAWGKSQLQSGGCNVPKREERVKVGVGK